MNNLDTIFKKMTEHFTNTNTITGVNTAGTIHQLTVEHESIIIGQDTLRCSYSNNRKNAMISFTPCAVSVGSYQRDVELILQLPSSALKNEYSRLHIDGGELFQLSTVHDFDFVILQDILAKYLELLKVIKKSPRRKTELQNVDEAIKNVSEAVELYKKEA